MDSDNVVVGKVKVGDVETDVLLIHLKDPYRAVVSAYISMADKVRERSKGVIQGFLSSWFNK